MTEGLFRPQAVENMRRLSQEEDKTAELTARLRLPRWPLVAVTISLLALLTLGLAVEVPVIGDGADAHRPLLIDVLVGGSG